MEDKKNVKSLVNKLDGIDVFDCIEDEKGENFVDMDLERYANDFNRYIGKEWRKKAIDKFIDGDREGMIDECLPALQYNLLDLAFNSEKEEIRFNSSKFLMGQVGLGEVKKVEHLVDHKSMGTDELLSLIAGKLNHIRGMNPDFNINKLIELTEGKDYEEEDDDLLLSNSDEME